MARSSKSLMAWLGIACGVALGGILFNLAGCGNRAGGPVVFQGLPEEANRMIEERGLTPDDVTAALSTFMPTGKHDDYILFASGGHSGFATLGRLATRENETQRVSGICKDFPSSTRVLSKQWPQGEGNSKCWLNAPFTLSPFKVALRKPTGN